MYKILIKIFVFVLLLLTPFWISRFFLIINNSELVISEWSTYLYIAARFDLKTLAIWYAPLFIFLSIGLFYKKKWWKLFCRIVFLLLFFGAFLFGMIAALYYPIAKVIVGAELFTLVKGQDITVLFSYFAEYWYAVLALFMALYFAHLLNVRTEIVLKRKSAIFLSVVSLLLLAFFARGGVALKPLNLLDAYSALPAKEATTATSPVYVLIESFGKSEIEYISYHSEAAVLESIKEDKLVYSTPFPNSPNICLILLESFGKEYTGLNSCDSPSYTPFLDSLMSVSQNYTNAYANGLRSMDAVASVFSGVPALLNQPFIGSLYTQSNIESTFEAILKNGYTTSFFHAADEQSMGFKPFLKSQGLNNYYAKQQYPDPEDLDGTWGVFDEPFLQYFASEIGKQKQPWFSGVFTLSSHHPYTIPEKYSNLPKGTNEIHQSIGYTDQSLRKFFKTAVKQPWFDNTIFIITADHTSINQSDHYRSYRGKYSIPMMIYAPKYIAPKEISRIVQHVDIFPTVKQIGGQRNMEAAGRSLLDTVSAPVVHFDGNLYVCTNDSLSLRWNGADEIVLFKYKEDPNHAHDVNANYPVESEIMFDELRMTLQKFNFRMLHHFK